MLALASQGPLETSRDPQDQLAKTAKAKPRKREKDVLAAKRRCVSSACTACRRRKSKCDGNTPSCAACASVYGTECIYDPNSDHRRKGVYKKDIDNLKTRNSTLQTLIQAVLTYPEDEVMELVKDIRACVNLDDVADKINKRLVFLSDNDNDEDGSDDIQQEEVDENGSLSPTFEKELAGKMGELRLENGEIRFLGGTSNLLYGDLPRFDPNAAIVTPGVDQYLKQEDAVRSWTGVTDDVEVIIHLLNLYFTWHYTYFTTLSKYMFFKDFFAGKPVHGRRKTDYCTSLLVNAMLALGCHFTTWPASRSEPNDSGTAGDHFFREAKRLIVANDEYEHPKLATVQALSLMSVREAGCGREAKGWVYSGMGFRMALDLGLNVDSENTSLDENEIDARRITFWGCFLFDKCWSNYLGRPPQLPLTNVTVSKIDVFPAEDADRWSGWNDSGPSQANAQPARTRAVALQITALCEISDDLILSFYRPIQSGKPLGKQAEVKKLSDFHTRLDLWRKALPLELQPREGQLPNVLVMHMFYNLLFIHLFRPFLKYSQGNTFLPAHVSPRKMCTQAALTISRLLRVYKRTHGLRQICNIAVYIAHSACTIHLLNFPDKDAQRDIAHGVKNLEEIAEMWLCARRTLAILSVQARKWNIRLPDDTFASLTRAEAKYGHAALSPQSQSESYFSNPASPALDLAGQISQPISHATTTPAYAQTKLEPMYSPESGMAGVRQAAFLRGNPGFHQSAEQASSASSPGVPGLQNTPPPNGISPTSLFGGAENTFEDCKDWWLKDQSLIFDQWSKKDTVASGAYLGNNLQITTDAGINAGASMRSAAPANAMALANGMDGMGDFDINYGLNDLSAYHFPKNNGFQNMEYLDFGQGNTGYEDNATNGF